MGNIIKDNEFELENFFAINLGLLCVSDLEGTLLKLSKGWESVTGISISEMEGKRFLDFVHPEDIDSTLNVINDLGKDDSIIKFITRYIGMNNSYRYIEWHTQIHNQLIYAIAYDITEQLKLSEEFEEQKDYAQLLLDTVPSAVFSVNKSSRITSWNKRAEEITGYSREEIIGENCTIFSEEPCKEGCGLYCLDIEKPIYNKLCTIKTKSGEFLNISKNVNLLRNHEHQVIGGIECFENITDNLKVEERLKESEERYAAIVNNAPEIVLIHQNGIIVFINHSGVKSSGFEVSEIVGKSIFDFLTEESRKNVASVMKRRETESRIEDYELQFVTKSQKVVDLIVKSSEIKYNNSKAILTVLIDITERRKMEDELRAKENILSAVSFSIKQLLDIPDYYQAVGTCIEVLGKAIGVDRVYMFENTYDEDGNGTTSQMLEWNSGIKSPKMNNVQLQNVEFSRIITVIDTLQEGKPFYGIVKDFKNDEFKQILIDLNIFSIIIFPVFVNRVFWGFIGFDECRFERVWTEGEFSTLSAFTNSLERAIERRLVEEELLKAKFASEAANIMKGQFLANMSHEIRTPMNGIIGFLELIQRTNLSFEQKEYVREAQSASEILLYLINDILDFSKIEAGKLTVEKIRYNIRTAIEDAVSIIMPKANEKNIEVNVNVKENVPEEVIGDPARLRQVMNNLVSNAVKFTDEGEVNIIVDCETIDNKRVKICIEVQDTGIGISQEAIDRLFKPFIQADSSTTRKFGGTGLGLAISKELVRLMEGDICVRSSLGDGSVFSFYFHVDEVRETSKKKSFIRLYDKNILIVDDNKNNRRIIKSYLEKTGCQVVEAEGAEKAITTLLLNANTTNKIDLAIIDYQMPGMDGYMLANTIKQIPTLSDTKLILLTSVAQKGGRNTAQENGFSGYLAKPIRRDELFNCMSIIFGLSREEEDESFETKSTAAEDLNKTKPKILLVEDNEMNQKIAIAMLKHKEYTCDIAVNGKEALKAIQHKNYDIIFMDCQMPIMDGYECTQKIRTLEQNGNHTTIVAMTANAMEGDRKKCMDVGMDDYLSKPLNFDMFLGVIEHTLLEKTSNMSNPHGHKDYVRIYEYMEEFIAKTGLQQEDVVELFDEYIGYLPSMLEHIEQAIKEEDFSSIVKFSHQLKGSSGSLRINTIYELGLQLEEQGKIGDLLACENTFSQIKINLK